MRILTVGDIVGRAGLQKLKETLYKEVNYGRSEPQNKK